MKSKYFLLALFLICVGSITQSLVMIKSGLVYDYGMGFWGPNAHDGLWHIALINQISKFDFSHPSFSGFSIMNYHYGFDLLTAVIHRLTLIPVVNLYFQILPPIFSALAGILLYKLVSGLFSPAISIFTLFFFYFGGSFGYVINYLKGQPLGGESTFWAIQPISYLVNPPFILSIIFIFSGLFFYKRFYWIEKRRLFFWLAVICFGGLVMIKIYAGILVLAALSIIGVIEFVMNKKLDTLKLFFCSLVLAFFLFVPSNKSSANLLEFEPLWFPRTMMEFTDRVGWERFSNARRAYMESKNYFKWIPFEIIAVVIFFVGNLGTRIIGLHTMAVTINRGRFQFSIPSFFVLLTILSVIPTLLFVQKGTPWNIIQFFYYTEVFMALPAAVVISKLWDNKRLNLFSKYLLVTILVITTIPTSISTLFSHYLPLRPPSAIPLYELEVLNVLKNLPNGIVLTYPADKTLFSQYSEPRPLFVYESTAYVSALSNHQTFLEDEVNLEISDYPWRARKEKVLEIFKSSDNEMVRQFLFQNNIKYVYHVEGIQPMNFGPEQVGLREIYDVPHKARLFEFIQ